MKPDDPLFRHDGLLPWTSLPAFERGGAAPAGAAITLAGVSFRYAGQGQPVFSHLTMGVQRGALAAVIGPSGSGKSTLVKLLQGLHAPACGTLRVGGLTHPSACAPNGPRVSVVPADGMLFAGSVMSNLLMANPRASREAVVAACRKAGVHRSILQFDGHYCADIGEGGSRLSLRQRRLLVLARALMKQPEVLVLDDCLSGPADGWLEMTQAVNRLKGEMTVLVTGRRLPPLLEVDVVFRLGPHGAQRMDVIRAGKPGPQTTRGMAKR